MFTLPNLFGLKHLRLHLKSTLARNTGWMLAGQGLRLLIQAAYFTVIARSLGSQNYGAFVGVVGLVGILMPFATMGSGYLLIKNVARDHSQFRDNWGRALFSTCLFSSIFFVVVTLASHYLLPGSIPIGLVMMVAASDLFGTSIITICGHAFIAFERLKWTASINVVFSALRLSAALTLVVLHSAPSASQWGMFHLLSTLVATCIALTLVFVRIGTPRFKFVRSMAEMREGLYFSIGQSAQTIYNDIDKSMLARMGTLQATGIYGAAYRLIDVSFAPVTSLLAAANPNFFRTGAAGMPAALRYAKPLIVRALGYASLVSLAVLLAAGLVPVVLGGEYRMSEAALRWLAVLPILKVIHFFFSDALAGAGHQALRTAIHVTAAVFNILINLWIIPAYSWRGAAWSSIATDGLLACAMASAAYILSRRSQLSRARADVVELRAEA